MEVGNLVNASDLGAIGCEITEGSARNSFAVGGVSVGSLITSCFLAATLAEIDRKGIAVMFSLWVCAAESFRAAE